MKKFRKFAALGLLLGAACASLIGCRNEKQLSEQLAVIKLGSENVTSMSAGEIMVYETLKTEYDIAQKLSSCVVETYIKFDQRGELQYDFTESTKYIASGDVSKYEATKENGSTVVSRNGEAVAESEAPDIFSYFALDYELADIEGIEVINAGNGKTIYAVTMTEKYADRFDDEKYGVKSTCEKVLYNYYITTEGSIDSLLSEYTLKVEADGKTQTVVRFVQSTVND